MIGVVIGALGTIAAMAHAERVRVRQHDAELVRLPMCTITIVLVGADDSAVSRAIDAKTGGRGFSHVYLDPCRLTPDGSRAIIDYRPGDGVHWADARRYDERPKAWIELRGVLGHEVFGCVQAKLGRPFKLAPLLAKIETEGTCIGLIVHCLPPSLRRSIRGEGGCVAPNDLARFFGVAAGDRIAVDDGDVTRMGSTISQQYVRSR